MLLLAPAAGAMEVRAGANSGSIRMLAVADLPGSAELVAVIIVVSVVATDPGAV